MQATREKWQEVGGSDSCAPTPKSWLTTKKRNPPSLCSGPPNTPRLKASALQAPIFPINVLLAPQPSCSVKKELLRQDPHSWGMGGWGFVSVQDPSPRPSRALYQHLNLRVSKRERKRVMSGRGDLLPAEGSGGCGGWRRVGSASSGSQTCQGAPQSPQSRHPAVLLNSLPSNCPPRRPLRPVTDATTGNALLLSRPRPRPPFLPPPPPGLGPQALDPRTRVAAVTDWGDPSAGHCPWPSPRPLHL